MSSSAKFSQVAVILILDSDGNRIAVKYLTDDPAFGDFKQQEKFEQGVVAKSSKIVFRSEVEVVMVDKYVVLFKNFSDAFVYLIGPETENELLLLEVMNALIGALQQVTSNISKRTLMENLDSVFLVIDELTDGGVVMQTNSQVIVNRCSMVDATETTHPTTGGLKEALAAARRQLIRN
eukprot:Platyproteum_vivax@DN7365_c0_g1_i4.p2